MTTKTNNRPTNIVSMWLWCGAILAVLIVIGILGWQSFYGFVIPQANKATSLPLTGVIGFAVIAGALSFFAPCPFAVFPAYAAFFLANKQNHNPAKTQALRFAATASAGVVSFYVLLGVVLASLGTQLSFYTNYLKLGAIALIFLFGLVLLTEKQLPTRMLDAGTRKLSQKLKNWGAFGYGVIYAIAGAACFLPVILTITLIPILSGKFTAGLIAFASYGLAISIMLIIATLILASGKHKLLQQLSGKSTTIKKLAGAILIATALFLVAFYIQTGM